MALKSPSTGELCREEEGTVSLGRKGMCGPVAATSVTDKMTEKKQGRGHN